jgi:hypothetical protein
MWQQGPAKSLAINIRGGAAERATGSIGIPIGGGGSGGARRMSPPGALDRMPLGQ